MSSQIQAPVSAMQMKDVDSRYMLQTRTNTQPWDQVTGVSQDIVNKNFENLFRIYPQMSSMDAMSSRGRIVAKLEPPKILIPAGTYGSNTSEVLFLLRFKSGSVYDEEGMFLVEDLAGWVIAYSVPLKTFSDDPSKAKTFTSNNEQQREEALSQSLRERLKLNGKELPGQYSIERLYAKLSSAKFSDPDTAHSVAVIDGEKLAWSDWATDNYDAYDKLKSFIERWAIDQDKNGRNAMGYNIQLKDFKTPLPPTFEPTDLVYQTHAYKSAPLCPDGKTSEGGFGGRNALLYCEMVEHRQRPDDFKLVWSGNFTTMPSSPGASDAIEGTFLMNRDVFLERFILPKIRQLNQASEICHLLPRGEQDGDRISCHAPYTTSVDHNLSISSPCYDFININKTNNIDLTNGYRFKKVNIQPPDDSWATKQNSVAGMSNFRGKMRDETQVSVTWQRGSPILTIEGTMTSHEVMEWDQGGDPNLTSWERRNLWAFLDDTYTAKWKITMTFCTIPGPNNNGILGVKFDTGDDHCCGVSVTLARDHNNLEEKGRDQAMLKSFKARFSEIVPQITRSIEEKVAQSGGFIFPGNGVFSFKNPAFTQWGDLVAEIDYLPLKADSMVLIPAPTEPLVVKPPPIKIETPIMSAPPGQYTLNWISNPEPCILKPNQYQKLVFRGVNETGKPVAFKEIRLTFTAKKGPSNLFYTSDFFLKGQEPKSGPTEKSTSSAASPGAAAKVSSETQTKTTAGDASNNTPVQKNGESGLASDTSAVPTGDTAKAPVLPAQSTTSDKPIDATTDAGVSGKGPSDQAEGPGLLARAKHAIAQKLKGAPEAAEEPESGIVSLGQSPGKTSATIKLVCQTRNRVSSKSKLIKWLVTVDDISDTLRLEPNEWIEVVLEGRVNMEGSYSVGIDEEYVQPDGFHWSGDSPVIVR